MQLTTIDDLLDLAGRGGDEAAGLSSAVEMLQFAAPTLVLLARADGAVVFADDFASGAPGTRCRIWPATLPAASSSRTAGRSP